jgi:anti-anti-sigma factor
MAISVRRDRAQRRIVVAISGALDAEAVPTLRRALARALRTRAPILIDLAEATSIHNTGLALLMAAHRQAQRTGTPLLLRAGPTQIRTVLQAFGIPPEDAGPPARRR